MIGFRIKGIRFGFDFGFFMALAFFSLFDSYGLAVCVLCASVIHESGHIITAVLCGVEITAVYFRAEGIRMVTDRRIKPFSKDALILLSGPVFNLAAAMLYYYEGQYDSFAVNLVIGCYNLLPFSKLDGGALLSEVLEWFGIFSPVVMRALSLIFAAGLMLFFSFTGTGSIILYITLIFLAVSEFCY